MRKIDLKREAGQTLIYVAAGLVMLLAFVSLAVDVGHVYSERRRMQNAADAGALAGAHELCLGSTQAVAAGAARNYALLNGAQVVTPTVDMSTYVVNVSVAENASLFVAPVIGISTMNVPAVAAAACGPADTACGLFPLAFDLSQWNQVKDTCGQHFYVWTGEKADAAPDCTSCKCDTDDDGKANIFPGDGRAWLDMSSALNSNPLYPPPACAGSGCGLNEIRCWINNLQPAPFTIPPGGICISGVSGKKKGVQSDVNARAGDIVKVPLFNGLCSGTTCTGGFNVTKFGCVQVIRWVPNLSLDPLPLKTCKWKDDVIEVAVSCDKAACEDKCGHTPGGPCTGGSQVCAVNLVQ